MTSPSSAPQAFGRDLDSAFLIESSAAPFGEVALFRALMRSFAVLKPRYKIDEYHGSKHQVYFDTSQSWLRKRARCELCDLLVIAYSASGMNVRLTLLQTKLSSSRHESLGSAKSGAIDDVAFHANYEQWDLLAARPVLLPTTVFKPPRHLLSAAVVPSVGSFGVFHRESSGGVGFFYASADCLMPVSRPKAVQGRLRTDIAVPRDRRFGGHADISYCSSLALFGAALFSLKIGTPVVTSSGGVVTHHQPWAHWVRSIVESHVRTAGEADSPGRELLRYLTLPNERVTRRIRGALPSLLVISGADESQTD